MPISLRVKDHYEDNHTSEEISKEFKHLLDKAERAVSRMDGVSDSEVRAQEFMETTVQRYKSFGIEAYFSEKQFAWLERLATGE